MTSSKAPLCKQLCRSQRSQQQRLLSWWCALNLHTKILHEAWMVGMLHKTTAPSIAGNHLGEHNNTCQQVSMRSNYLSPRLSHKGNHPLVPAATQALTPC